MTDKDKLFKEISDAFIPVLNKGNRYNAGTITNGVREETCRFFQKNISERIAYIHKISGDDPHYIVISEKGIYDKYDFHFLFLVKMDSVSHNYFFSWEEINRIEFSTKSNDFYIYFDEGYESYYKIGCYDMIHQYASSYCIQIAELLTKYAKLYKGSKELYDEVLQLEKDDKFQEAFELADRLVKENQENEEDLVPLRWLRGREKLNSTDFDNEDSEKSCDSAIADFEWSISRYKKFEGYDWLETTLHYWLSMAYRCKGDPQKSRMHSLGAVCDEAFAAEMRENLDDIDSKVSYYDNYLDDYEYVNRKYIMPLKSIEGCYSDKIEVFLPQKMPKGIMFPSGIAKENQIYIGHPYNKAVYVPLQDMEDAFFVDKIHELCYLLQCLGAEEISITSVVGKSLSELNNSTINMSGNADVKAFSGQFVASSNSDIKKETTSNNERTIKYTLDPMRSPFVPEGLVWYPMVPEWQRLVKSRMNTNVLEYSETVSTSQVRFTSDSEKEELKASARYLWAKANTSIDTNVDKQFKETTETQWKIEVKFRSLKDFDTDSAYTNELSSEEKEYLDELKECLAENAQISLMERRLLDKFRDRLGISKERADELEHRVMKPVLTDEEKEYIEIFKELSGEGEITERKRRMLNRERDALGITVERASELEQIDRPVS